MTVWRRRAGEYRSPLAGMVRVRDGHCRPDQCLPVPGERYADWIPPSAINGPRCRFRFDYRDQTRPSASPNVADLGSRWTASRFGLPPQYGPPVPEPSAGAIWDKPLSGICATRATDRRASFALPIWVGRIRQLPGIHAKLAPLRPEARVSGRIPAISSCAAVGSLSERGASIPSARRKSS